MSQKKKKQANKSDPEEDEEEEIKKEKSFRKNSNDSEKGDRKRKKSEDRNSRQSGEEDPEEEEVRSKKRVSGDSDESKPRRDNSGNASKGRKASAKKAGKKKSRSRSRPHGENSEEEEGSEKYLEKLLFKLNKAEDKIERVRDHLREGNNFKEKKEQIDVLSGQIIESVKKNKISKIDKSIISQDIRNGMENNFIETMARNQLLEDENRELKEKLKFKDNFISELEAMINHYKLEVERLHDEIDRKKHKKHKEKHPSQQNQQESDSLATRNQLSIGKSLLDENLWLMKNEKFAEEQFNMDLPPKTLPPVKRLNHGNIISQSLREEKYRQLLEKSKASEVFAGKKKNAEIQHNLAKSATATEGHSLLAINKSKPEKKLDSNATDGKAEYYKRMQQQRDKNAAEIKKSSGAEIEDKDIYQQNNFEKLKKQLNKGDEFALVKNYPRGADSEEPQIFDYKNRKQLN